MPSSPPSQPTDRRERKKAATRQRISDVATALFAERGFDAVTVNEVAEAADVSKVTVFNHFSRKEDMFFDRFPQALELLTDTVTKRPTGQTVFAAVRQLCERHIREQHPLLGMRERFVGFWQVILASPALQQRVREFVEELETLLTRLIEAEGEFDAAHSRLFAGWMLAVIRAGFGAALNRVVAGDEIDTVNEEYLTFVDRGFAAVEAAAELV